MYIYIYIYIYTFFIDLSQRNCRGEGETFLSIWALQFFNKQMYFLNKHTSLVSKHLYIGILLTWLLPRFSTHFSGLTFNIVLKNAFSFFLYYINHGYLTTCIVQYCTQTLRYTVLYIKQRIYILFDVNVYVSLLPKSSIQHYQEILWMLWLNITQSKWIIEKSAKEGFKDNWK